MRTVRYRTVPSKIDHQRSISAVGSRLKKKSAIGGRLRNKKGRRRGKEKKRSGEERIPRPRAVLARLPSLPAGRRLQVTRGRFFCSVRRRSVSPREEKDR
ncbi:hypothetical protein BHM03_00052418, partial [Ensete ventricosum]